MKILVVDDEQLARQRLAMMIAELGDAYEVVGEADNGELAVERAIANEADVVLMDIHMPGMDGLEAARNLAELPLPPAVIFTTAYEEHALPAFSSRAVDYLLKPISTAQLRQALEKVSLLTRPQQAASQEQDEFITAHIRGETRRIPLADIYYLQADSKYVSVLHTRGSALIEDSLVSLEQRFPGRFIRIHRNALVNGSRVSALGKNEQGQVVVRFDGTDDSLPVSRRHLAELRRWFSG